MKKMFSTALTALVILIVTPMAIHAQSAPASGQKPPIAQPLEREGDLAVKLVDVLKMGTTTSEAEAENKLGDAGIAPRNGWIADYPVTPDVISELRKSITDAADAKRLNMGKDEALQAYENVMSGVNLEVRGSAPGQASQKVPGSDNAPNETVINNYYSDQGPPVVTYYAPPPDYVYLYTWVPYPFWWWNFWFPGFFILGDFHRVVHVHNRVEIISNHFVDHRANRVFRIDPVKRFRGRTFGGVGVPHNSRRFMITGAGGGNQTIFRGSRERAMTGREKTPMPHSGREREGGFRDGGGRMERR